MKNQPDTTSDRAQTLWGKWVGVARAEGYTPPETMIALAGGIAEMIRTNVPQSTWEDHIATVAADIRYILTGVSPTDTTLERTSSTRIRFGDKGAKNVAKPRTRHRKSEPKTRRVRH